MSKRFISEKMIEKFEMQLHNEEKSEATICKYLHDLRFFMMFAHGRQVDKELTIAYKAELAKKYSAVSANSMIAALNTFLRSLEWNDCCVKQFKLQKKVYCAEERELSKAEYIRLVKAAKKKGNQRLNLILQTICGTGIRVSELHYITVEAVAKGEAVVSCKNKTRRVFIVRDLQKKLLRYIKDKNILSGCVFITKSGKPMNRSNVWREMKELSQEAGVLSNKVFPHNLRHLFARIFYGIEKDIAKLADILGHSNVNTTRIYIISTGAEHKRQMENMKLII